MTVQRIKRPKLAIAVLVIALVGAVALAVLGVRGVKNTLPPGPGEPVGLLTSMPIYWSDGADIADFAQSDIVSPWTRTAIERDYELRPLDALTSQEDIGEPLPGLEMPAEPITGLNDLKRLAIIQPRGLSPEDNVALDDWVKTGGHLLLVLDPMLTGHYETPVFDPRHPVGSALIPPVVERWGLEVQFDDTQSFDLRLLEASYGLLPAVMAGLVKPREGFDPQCSFEAEDVLAQCQVGEGRVTLVADAALFEAESPGEEGEFLLRSLLRAAFE